MIKADRFVKVKAQLRNDAARSLGWILLFVITLFCTVARAELSEREVQTLEAQEFGIEKQKTTKTKPSENPPAEYSEDYQPKAEQEKVKPIEAEEFPVKLRKKSTSGRVLMFDDPSANRPQPGKVLLLKEGKTEVAAIRVLKNYKGKFAAKVVLPLNQVNAGAEYRALKKLGDKIIALIKEREKRGKNLDDAKTDEDLAKEVSPDDNELDRGIPQPKAPKKGGVRKGKPDGSPGPDSPEPLFTKDGLELEDVEAKEDLEFSDPSVQEDLPVEPYRHAVSLEYGNMRSIDKDNNYASYNGVGVRYAFNFWRMPILKSRSLQDMFSAEISLFYYAINGFIVPDDSIVVTPLILTLRYHLLVGENLGFYGYVGFIKNNVSQGEGAVTSNVNVSQLARTKAALGIGSLIKIGPAWAARLDFGTDLFGIGAVLKF